MIINENEERKKKRKKASKLWKDAILKTPETIRCSGPGRRPDKIHVKCVNKLVVRVFRKKSHRENAVERMRWMSSRFLIAMRHFAMFSVLLPLPLPPGERLLRKENSRKKVKNDFGPEAPRAVEGLSALSNAI